LKLVCDSGNEVELKPEPDMEEDERGQYVKIDSSKFDKWAEHDEAGFTCQKCKKAIWYFA
jgi:hypothetical protein